MTQIITSGELPILYCYLLFKDSKQAVTGGVSKGPDRPPHEIYFSNLEQIFNY